MHCWSATTATGKSSLEDWREGRGKHSSTRVVPEYLNEENQRTEPQAEG